MGVRLFTLGSLLGVMACTRDDTDVVDLSSDGDRVVDGLTDDDDDDSDLPVDSATTDDGIFDIYYLQVEATFGWDNASQSIVTVLTEYGEIPPAIVISLGDPSWEKDDFAADSEGYCVIVLPLTDPYPVPSWVTRDGSLYFGFDYRASDDSLTDCGTPGYEYDESRWGTNLHEEFAAQGWGVAIGSLRPEYYANFATSILLPNLAGAQINNALIQTPANEGVLGYVAVASEIDAAHNLLVETDGRQPLLDASAIEVPGGGMATALYRVLPLYIFTFSASP